MMSRPYYNSTFDSHSDTNSYTVILIDNSPSMHEFISNNSSKLINDIIKPLNDMSRVDILALDDLSYIYSGSKRNLNTEKLTIPKSLNNNRINKASHLLNNKKYNVLNKYLFIISDSQESIFNINKDLEYFNGWKTNYINTYKKINNLSIYNVYSEESFISANNKFKIKADVFNNGSYNIENHEIELFVNDISVGKNIINIEQNDRKVISYNLSVPESGQYRCYIKSSVDDKMYDNRFYFTINVIDEVNVDLIDTNNNIFLKNILESFNLNEKFVKINNYTLNQYMNTNSIGDLLFIVGVNNINKQLISKIKQSNLSNSFKIIFFPDVEDIDIMKFNTILNDNNFKNSKRKQLANPNFLNIELNNISNESIKNIFKNGSNRNIKVFNYIALDRSDKTIISLNNNDFLLNRYKIDNLDLLLFSISMDLRSSNLPIKGNVIPLMKNLITTEKIISYISTNTNLNNSFILKNIQINSPSGQIFSIDNNANNKTVNEIGFYNYNNKFRNSHFAVNIDSRELMGEFLLEKNNISQHLPDNAQIININENIYENIKNTIVGYELWTYFLILVIILLIAEMYLSTSIIRNE